MKKKKILEKGRKERKSISCDIEKGGERLRRKKDDEKINIKITREKKTNHLWREKNTKIFYGYLLRTPRLLQIHTYTLRHTRARSYIHTQWEVGEGGEAPAAESRDKRPQPALLFRCHGGRMASVLHCGSSVAGSNPRDAKWHSVPRR